MSAIQETKPVDTAEGEKEVPSQIQSVETAVEGNVHYKNLFGLRKGDKINAEASVKNPFKFLFTPQFVLCLFLGQFLSLCLTASNVTTQQLAIMNANIPTFQTLINYILLAVVYTSITLYKYGFKGWFKVVIHDGWKYFLLAGVDVEGNFFLVKAYGYTNLLSAELLDGFTIRKSMEVMLS